MSVYLHVTSFCSNLCVAKLRLVYKDGESTKLGPLLYIYLLVVNYVVTCVAKLCFLYKGRESTKLGPLEKYKSLQIQSPCLEKQLVFDFCINGLLTILCIFIIKIVKMVRSLKMKSPFTWTSILNFRWAL